MIAPSSTTLTTQRKVLILAEGSWKSFTCTSAPNNWHLQLATFSSWCGFPLELVKNLIPRTELKNALNSYIFQAERKYLQTNFFITALQLIPDKALLYLFIFFVAPLCKMQFSRYTVCYFNKVASTKHAIKPKTANKTFYLTVFC